MWWTFRTKMVAQQANSAVFDRTGQDSTVHVQ